MPYNCTETSDPGLQQHLLFQRGFKFCSKYIGTVEVPRPVSRLEIVSAMRRIRFDFKARAVRKKNVLMEVSLDGVSVSLSDKQKSGKSQSHPENFTPLFKNPIHRIFYVSHDSKDVKIFSYIAKEDDSNVFKCSVFKALKKKDAGEIVKTIGQAFEVSHLAHQAKKQQQQQQQQQQLTLKQLHLKRTLKRTKCADDDDNTHTDTHADAYTDFASLGKAENSSLLSLPLNADVCSKENEKGEEDKEEEDEGSSMVKGQENTLLKSQNRLLHKQLQVLHKQLQVEMQARKQAETLSERLLSQNRDLFAQIDNLLQKLSFKAHPSNKPQDNSNKRVECSNEKIFKSRTMDLSLLPANEHSRESKNSPDSGLNEMEGSEDHCELDAEEKTEREETRKILETREGCQEYSLEKDVEREVERDHESHEEMSEERHKRGVENEAVDSTPVRLNSKAFETSYCNGSTHIGTPSFKSNGTNGLMSASTNGAVGNRTDSNEKVRKHMHLSLSASFFNKVNGKWMQGLGRGSKHETAKNEKIEKLVRPEKERKTGSRPVSSVSERLDKAKEGVIGVVSSRWGNKLDRMISIRKSMGDSTTELELSFED